MNDKFGNEIHEGDEVLFAYDSNLFAGRITRVGIETYGNWGCEIYHRTLNRTFERPGYELVVVKK